MKNSAAFESSTSTSGQVHVFTSFPDTHLDEDPENYMASPDANKQANARLLDESFLAEEANTPTYSLWQLEYYQKYFNVNTNDVLSRITASILPTFNQSFLLNRIRPNPDLYGPFWICITLIFTISIAGNIYSYLSNMGSSEWQTDFHKLSSTAFVIILYWWLMPTFVYIAMRWRALVADFQFIEILSVYGYSLFVFIPVSILWLIHISIVQWVLVLMAIALSGSVLVLTFWPIFGQDTNKKVGYFIIAILLLMHSLLAIGFMLYFFHSPDHFEPPKEPTTTITNLVVTTNQTASSG